MSFQTPQRKKNFRSLTFLTPNTPTTLDYSVPNVQSATKTGRWLDKSGLQQVAEQNRISKAIFLAESPSDAVKNFANAIGQVKTMAPSLVDTHDVFLDGLKKLGVDFTPQERDNFLLRNSKKIVAEAQAMLINNNRGAYEKLKKLGGLKGTVSRKARRIYKKHYSRRGKH